MAEELGQRMRVYPCGGCGLFCICSIPKRQAAKRRRVKRQKLLRKDLLSKIRQIVRD